MDSCVQLALIIKIGFVLHCKRTLVGVSLPHALPGVRLVHLLVILVLRPGG